VALEKLDGISGAFITDTIMLLLSEDKPLDEKAVKKALNEHKIKIAEFKKQEKLPF